MAVALFGGGDDLAVADDQVRADDDADVVDLQALAGMDAADLFDGVLGDDPEAAVLVEVPLALVVADDDVLLPGILLAAPRPAVAGHDAGLVVLVPGGDGGVQGLGGVEDLEFVLVGVELLVGGRADVEHVVEPGEVAVRAIAAELRGEVVFLDRGAFRLGDSWMACLLPMSLRVTRWSSSMKKMAHLEASISSLIWFSPRLP